MMGPRRSPSRAPSALWRRWICLQPLSPTIATVCPRRASKSSASLAFTPAYRASPQSARRWSGRRRDSISACPRRASTTLPFDHGRRLRACRSVGDERGCFIDGHRGAGSGRDGPPPPPRRSRPRPWARCRHRTSPAGTRGSAGRNCSPAGVHGAAANCPGMAVKGRSPRPATGRGMQPSRPRV